MFWEKYSRKAVGRRVRNVTGVIVLIILVAALVFALPGALLVGCRPALPDDFSIVASIGGEPVALGELRMFLSSPGQPARDALDGLAPFIVCRRELKRLGGETFGTYRAFWDAWQAENARRAEALGRGEVVYGPEALTQRVYYDYTHEQDMRALAGLMASASAPTQDELRAAYNERADLFTVIGSVNMRVILLPPGKDPGVVASLRGLLSGGESFDDAAQVLGLGGMTYPRTFTASDFRHPDVTEFDGVADAIRDLPVGEFAQPIDNNGAGWIILYCESRVGAGREPFEQCSATLSQLLSDERFERDFAALVEGAAIVADDGLDEILRSIIGP